MKTDHDDILKFYGRQEIAILPIILYVVFGGALMIITRCYSMKVLIVAAILSLFTGFMFCKNKKEFWCCIVRGLAQYGNARLILVFMVIGIFSKLLVTGGIGGGFIWLSTQLGLHGGSFVVFCFIGCSIISMGAGAPIAAMFAVIPIFYPAGVMMGANPAILIGSMMSGIFFGDALSPSSQVIHTTIASQHDAKTHKSADLLETMKERLPYIASAGILSAVFFLIFGGNGGVSGDIAQAEALSDVKGLLMLIPILVMLIICFKTSDLFVGVSGGIFTAIVVGLLTGVYQMQDLILIDTQAQSVHGVFFDGVSSMTDIILSTILLYGLIQVAVEGGMMRKCCDFLLSRKLIQTTTGAETIIAAGVGIVNVLLAGCVLPSIIMFKDVADEVGQKANIPPSRRSILLTAMATNVTAIVPINSSFVMGAVTVVQEMAAKNSILPLVTPFQIFISSFYCLILTVICIAWVSGLGRKQEKTKHLKHLTHAKEW